MTSELVTLYQDVKTALQAGTPEDQVPAISVVFGRKEPAKQTNQGPGRGARVVFMHGTPEGDAGGETAPRYPGATPRAVKDQLEAFTVYVWGYDGAHANDEAVQHDACWTLFCRWRLEVFKRAEGRVTIEAKRWVAPDRPERAFGAELEVRCTIRSQVLETTRTGVDAHPLEADIDAKAVGNTDHAHT